MADPIQIPIPGTEAAAPPPAPIAPAEPAPVHAAPIPQSEFHYGDNVHELIKGRSAAEVAAMFGKLADLAVNGMARSQQQPAPTPPPANNGHNGNGIDPKLIETVTRQAASLSYGLAQQQHADTFRRFKGEIDGMLQSVPIHEWTPELIGKVATLVKGGHADELASERVREVTEAVSAGAMRSRGGSAYDTTPAPKTATSVREHLDQAPASWKEHAQRVGIGEREVEEYCRQTDSTPAEFFAQFGKGIFTDAVADVNPQRKG